MRREEHQPFLKTLFNLDHSVPFNPLFFFCERKRNLYIQFCIISLFLLDFGISSSSSNLLIF